MGNTSSSGVGTNLTSGFKQALDAKNNKLYQLIDFHGGGELVQWMKFAAKTGDYSIVDGVIEMKVMKVTDNEVTPKTQHFPFV